jgi:hypothetical protein
VLGCALLSPTYALRTESDEKWVLIYRFNAENYRIGAYFADFINFGSYGVLR